MAVIAVLSNTAFGYSGETEFPEVFNYNDEMNSNLETALHLISSSFNEKGVTVTQELLAAMMATLVKEVGSTKHKFEPREEEGDYGMGPDSKYTVDGSHRSTPYEGGVDYKGRGYIQLTLKENYQKYCPDCVAKESNVCGCEKQWLCSVTDPAICPQIKALQPERAASIFASYYIKSPSGKNLVSLSNAEKYLEVAHAINVDRTYNSEFETYAKDYLTLFRNNPDKTKKLLTWLSSGSTAAAEAVSIGFPVTLTLNVHEENVNGPTIPGVLVTGKDGAGHSFEQTTISDGSVTIAGIPGSWSFSASADGYETNNWGQEITEPDRKNAFLKKSEEQPATSNPQSIDLDSDNAKTWKEKGDALCDQDKYNEANKAYEEAIRLDPNFADAWSNKGLALDNLGRYNEALDACNRAIELNPLLSYAWCNKGFALCGLRKYDEALEIYNKAIEIDPQLPRAWGGRCAVWLEGFERYNDALKDSEKALELLRSEEESESDLAETAQTVWYNHGAVLYYLERYEDAINAFEESIKINPEFPDAWQFKGVALEKLNRDEEANDAFERACELDNRSFYCQLKMYKY